MMAYPTILVSTPFCPTGVAIPVSQRCSVAFSHTAAVSAEVVTPQCFDDFMPDTSADQYIFYFFILANNF